MTKALIEMFPEAKLTMREKLPTALILTAGILDIRRSIKDIQYSAEELRESIMGFVAMIPEELRDEEFYAELEKAKTIITIDVRPSFCEVKASVEYCQSHGIPTVQNQESFDYLAVFHACFNLLMRKHMLLKTEAKEIMTEEEPQIEQMDESE